MTEIILPSNSLRLYPFQENGLRAQLKAPLPCIYNADDMGLGKTIQALVYANSSGARSVLVISPAGARLNWYREAKTWFVNPNPYALFSSKDWDVPTHATPVIVSYDLLVRSKRVRDRICQQMWDLVVVDEAHNVKNIRAQRTQVVYEEVFPQCRRIYMMSGTPITNTAHDIFPFLRMVTPHVPGVSEEDARICQTYDAFGRKFCYRVVNPKFGIQYKYIRNTNKLKKLLNSTGLYFRRTKEQVLEDLPEKTYKQVDLPLKVSCELSDKAIREFLDEFIESDKGVNMSSEEGTHFMTLRRKLGSAKANCKEAHDYINIILEDYGKPVVLFAYHKDVIKTLRQKFRQHNPVVFDGSTSARDKQAAVDAFQDGTSQVFIGQLTSANVAITLTRSCDVIFIEYDWLAANNEQAIDRVYRIGQKNAVTAHYLVADHDFDRGLVEAMIQKQKLIERVI
jgi:SNF2 family DNA or RNA helicase